MNKKSKLNNKGLRTNHSLILSCLKRYPVPMTAWQIGRIIRRNPASVSSELVRMRRKREVLCFLGKNTYGSCVKRGLTAGQILYAPLNLNSLVQTTYSQNGDLKEYDNPPMR